MGFPAIVFYGAPLLFTQNAFIHFRRLAGGFDEEEFVVSTDVPHAIASSGVSLKPS